jgi:DNA-binding CsgD family transcriptional regulator
MAQYRDAHQSAVSPSATAMSVTPRQTEVLQLSGRGLSGKQIAHHLGISVRTVEDHFSTLRRRTGARSQGELIAYWTASGLIKPRLAVPESVVSGTVAPCPGRAAENRPANRPATACRCPGSGTGTGTISW